jgi:ribosomal protein S18 acetylase RimI-like enzyme
LTFDEGVASNAGVTAGAAVHQQGNPVTTTIRRATDADAEGAADVFIAARATMTYLPHSHSEAETRTFIGELVREEETWIAERDGKVVGVAVIDGGWLEHLYVHPSRFGAGTGTRLFQQLAAKHPKGFQLWVFQQNVAARRFYERLGCALVRLTDGDNNEEHLPDALYVWPGG